MRVVTPHPRRQEGWDRVIDAITEPCRAHDATMSKIESQKIALAGPRRPRYFNADGSLYLVSTHPLVWDLMFEV